MDIAKKRKLTKNVAHSPRSILLISVGITAIIAIAWAVWFLPNSLQKQNEGSRTFSAFKDTVMHSMKLFKKDKGVSGLTPDSSIEELRAQVFGDSISR